MQDNTAKTYDDELISCLEQYQQLLLKEGRSDLEPDIAEISQEIARLHQYQQRCCSSSSRSSMQE